MRKRRVFRHKARNFFVKERRYLWFRQMEQSPRAIGVLPFGVHLLWWSMSIFGSTGSPFIKKLFLPVSKSPKFPLGGQT
jgi:hypothetical protein